MSEEKIIKHAEKAVETLSNKKLIWKAKLKELTQEILIIVFAVSITLALHNWNDHQKDKEIERDFLVGTDSDLIQEKEKIISGFQYFQPTLDFYNTITNQILEGRVDNKYLDSNADYLSNTLYLTFDNGRFEGFKSSGYLRLIENKKLQKNLISLYTSDMPFEVDADNELFITRAKDFVTYIGSKAPIDSTGQHVSKIINDPAVRYQLVKYKSYFAERKRHKEDLIKQIDDLRKEIEDELKEL